MALWSRRAEKNHPDREGLPTIHGWEDVTVRMTLGELEKQLDNRFYRVGRSAIVNLTQIRRVTRTEITLSDGVAIPLPRGAYDGVNRAIIDRR